MRVVVVYVHGLWLWGGEAFLLRRRLEKALHAETRAFAYASVSAGITENALSLGRYLQSIRADTLHLVAHSMGGLVILKFFELCQPSGQLAGAAAALPPGRIVFTGSPVRGARSAARLKRLPLGRHLLGRTASEVLVVPSAPHWRGDRDLGVIAGDRAVGLGRALGQFDAPSDGTVFVDETELPGAADSVRLHVSHSGMVFSPAVAAQAASFLATGRFSRI